jgi:hemerythrin-like domain-containing protein
MSTHENEGRKEVESAYNEPMDLFTDCHARIHEAMAALRELAHDPAGPQPTREVQDFCTHMLDFFAGTVAAHHAEEERELWPLLERATPDAENHETFKAIGHRLKHEHEQLETLWSQIAPELHKLARGKPAKLEMEKVRALANMYDQHAAFEDAVVIPMARYLLDPSEQSRLGMSIALRRLPPSLRAYI